MIFQPWTANALDKREDACYALVDQGMNAVIRAALEELRGTPLVAAATPEEEPDMTGAQQAALAAWAIFVSTDLEPFLTSTFTQGAELVVDGLTSFLPDLSPVGSEWAADYLSSIDNRLVGIGDNLWRELRAELLAGFQAGESIQQLTERLSRYADISATRARTVARTEVVGAANAGSYIQVVEAGLECNKVWLATEDERTRTSHNHADSQSVPLNGRFSVEIWEAGELVGHDLMTIPGDPTASPGNVINCRCSPAYEFADDDLVTASAARKFVEALHPRDGDGKFTDKLGVTDLLGVDKRTGKTVRPGKPVYLRVKALYEVKYPDGAVIAERGDEELVWNARNKSVTHRTKSGELLGVYTRGALMAQRKDEEGWTTPAPVAPTQELPSTLGDEAPATPRYTLADLQAEDRTVPMKLPRPARDAIYQTYQMRLADTTAEGKFLALLRTHQTFVERADRVTLNAIMHILEEDGHAHMSDIRQWLETREGSERAAQLMTRFPHARTVPLIVTPTREAVLALEMPFPDPKASIHPRDYPQMSDGEARQFFADSHLTARERKAIEEYSGNDYRAINALLRDAPLSKFALKFKSDEALFRLAGEVQQGMRPLKRNTRLYRQVSGSSLGFPQGYVPSLAEVQAKVGKILTDRGFFSTTIRRDRSFGGVINYTILAPKGTPAQYIEVLSQEADEKEMLLAAGTRFMVLGVIDITLDGHTEPEYEVIVKIVP